jgi:hypothetical protein
MARRDRHQRRIQSGRRPVGRRHARVAAHGPTRSGIEGATNLNQEDDLAVPIDSPEVK